MHDVISKSNLFFGEGASMAAEAAVLGVPAIFLNDNWSGNAMDLTKHELMYCFKSSSEEQNNAITKAIEIATQNDKIYYQEKRKIYLEKKLDASSFLCWFITHYPISKKEVLKNPSNLADLI
jgi:predicted glycosyltransferase